MPTFKDIPKFIWGGSYCVDTSWDYTQEWMDSQAVYAPVEMSPDFQRGHDGKQRLTSVLLFLGNEVTVFGGHKFSDYTDKLRMTGPRFRMHVNNLETRAEVLQWYLELNSGGVVHTEGELNKVRDMLATELIPTP